LTFTGIKGTDFSVIPDINPLAQISLPEDFLYDFYKTRLIIFKILTIFDIPVFFTRDLLLIDKTLIRNCLQLNIDLDSLI